MTSPVTTRRPDAPKPDDLDLSEICEIAGRELIRCAEGTLAEALVNARVAANRVLAALDAYEART